MLDVARPWAGPPVGPSFDGPPALSGGQIQKILIFFWGYEA